MLLNYQAPPEGTPGVYHYGYRPVMRGGRVSYRPPAKPDAPSLKPLAKIELPKPDPMPKPVPPFVAPLPIHLDRLAYLIIFVILAGALIAHNENLPKTPLAIPEELKTADITKFYYINGHEWHYDKATGVWLDP